MDFQVRTSLLVVVDIQEKLHKAIPSLDPIMPKVKMLLEAAATLELDVLISEQYPKGLGHTVPELMSLASDKWPVIEKTSFSCFGDPAFRQELRRSPRKTVILIGLESHVCVMQTAMDLIAEDYEVVVIADAVASRNPYDREIALEQMRAKGAWVITAESFLFALMRGATHPQFRAISKLVR